MPIQKLPPDVASQIAAGEVVERPASVVKELVENSLDAGAKKIEIVVEGAGKKVIQVSDNGCGISTDELRLAIERHATSKILTTSDLQQISSLGFRGEALSAISSVSHLILTSQTENADVGASLRVEGGIASSVQTVGAPTGTTVRVENLFFNVPARLKFLKHDNTERRHITSLVTRYALAYPHVKFILEQEDRRIIQTSGNGDQREVLGVQFGSDTARQMLEVNFETEHSRVLGYISPTSITRSNRNGLIFFVNKRPVQDPALSAAVNKAYHTFLMVGRFPIVVLFLEVSAETVDVNVHPTKAEIRFREPKRIFSEIQNAVRRSLLAHGTVAGIDELPDWRMRSQARYHSGPPEDKWGSDPSQETISSDLSPFEKESQDEFSSPAIPEQPEFPSQKVPLLRPVGQIASAYLAAEGPDGLYLVDQHAAHERVLYERFTARANDEFSSQALLQPVSVEFSEINAQVLNEHLALISRMGFQVERFGKHTFLVRSVPAILSNTNPESLIRAVVEDCEEDETPLQNKIEALLIARVCKRAAVKAGQTLSPDEQRELLLDLENCAAPRTCPHGRPTMIHLSVDLLEKQFRRRGV